MPGYSRTDTFNDLRTKAVPVIYDRDKALPVLINNLKANLKQQVRASLSPTHLLFFDDWTGLLEGNVNKLKLIKRMMYGRADFPLLGQPVLYAL